jgi:hypothetical protein
MQVNYSERRADKRSAIAETRPLPVNAGELQARSATTFLLACLVMSGFHNDKEQREVLICHGPAGDAIDDPLESRVPHRNGG